MVSRGDIFAYKSVKDLFYLTHKVGHFLSARPYRVVKRRRVKRRIRLIVDAKTGKYRCHLPLLFCRLCGHSDECAAVIRQASRQEVTNFMCQMK